MIKTSTFGEIYKNFNQKLCFCYNTVILQLQSNIRSHRDGTQPLRKAMSPNYITFCPLDQARLSQPRGWDPMWGHLVWGP